MRMPTSKLYRAFPELDPFEDQKCIRFVRVAQGRWWWRGTRFICLVVLWVVAFAGLSWGLAEGASAILADSDNWRRTFGPIPEILGFVLCAGAGMAIASLGTLMLRDFLLRRSVRRVLKASANCWSCGYGLLGLPVSTERTITCPECGSVSGVDVSLAELSENNGRVVQSTELIAQRPPRIPIWRRKMVRRVAIGSLATLLLLAGSWEIWIRVQAARARAMNPGAKGLMAHVLKGQTTTSAESDAWSIAVAAGLAFSDAQAAVRGEYGGSWPKYTGSDEARKQTESPDAGVTSAPNWPLGEELYPEYRSVIREYPGKQGEEAKYFAAAGELARAVIASPHMKPVYDALRRLRVGPGGIAAVGGMRSIHLPDGEPAMVVDLPELGPMRQVARMQAGRVELLGAKGEVDEAIGVIEEMLVMSQVLGGQAFLIDRRVASEMQSMALTRVEGLLDLDLSTAQVERLAQLVRERTIRTSIDRALDGERLVYASYLSWIFGSASRTRFGMLSPGFVKVASQFAGSDFEYPDVFEQAMKHDLGTLGRNVRFADDYFAHYKAQAALPIAKRGTLPVGLKQELDRLVLAKFFTPGLEWALQAFDWERQRISGVQARLAIERYRHERGAYPDTLEQIAGLMDGGVPVDPMSGQPMLYKRVDPKTDESGLSYLLYVPGPDGTDNGGVRAKPPAGRTGKVTWRELPSGADYVLNDPER
jgi:hypothetical protein